MSETIHWSVQNLNDRRDGTQGSPWVHGRAWLYLPGSRHRVINPSWCWSKTHPGLGAKAEVGEGRVTFHVRLLWLSLWLTLEGIVPWRWLPRRGGVYGTELYVYDGGEPIFRFQWGADRWGSGQRSWRDVYFPVFDRLLGYHRHSERTLSTHAVHIPLPERSYAATVELKRERWKRPRWPIAKELTRGHVEIPDGIPVPGKGENAWDCGEDATYGVTCPAETVEAAIAAVVESVLRDRRRYGHSVAWVPSAQREVPDVR